MLDPYSLPEALQSLLRDEIPQGERVKWVGTPQPSSGFLWITLPLILFAVFDVGFALFWMAMASGIFDGGPLQNERLIFAAFGIPFLLIGVSMLTSPLWLRRRLQKSAENTLYVITDRRAVVFNGGYYGSGGLAMMIAGVMRFANPGIKVQSYTPDRLLNIERTEREDGTGNVLFGESELNYQVNNRPATLRTGFYSIADVREADRLLKELAATHRPAAAE
jgi:hypothetical protein